MKKIPLKDRFWAKVLIKSNNECWEWQAAKLKGWGSYGIISVNGKCAKAHRVSYELKHGSIPKDLMVLHKCDNTMCVNPAHLYLGTDKENTKDKVSKNRHVFMSGEIHGMSVLTNELVKQLRYEHFILKVSTCELSRKHKIHQSTLYKAVYGVTWKHVN